MTRMIRAEAARSGKTTMNWLEEESIANARKEVVDKVINDINWHINRIVSEDKTPPTFSYIEQYIDSYISKYKFHYRVFTGQPTIDKALKKAVIKDVSAILKSHGYSVGRNAVGISISWQ